MSDDLYTTTLAHYEQKFKNHNYQVMKNSAGVKMIAIHFHTAVELVEKGVWDAQKEHYFVILHH